MTTSVLPLNFLAGAVRFDEGQPGWTLRDRIDEAGKARTCSGRVTFERTFAAPPVVQVGITGFDIDNGDNARLNVSITAVDAEGFTVELRTWWNTRLWSVSLSWIAIGH